MSGSELFKRIPINDWDFLQISVIKFSSGMVSSIDKEFRKNLFVQKNPVASALL